MPRPYVDLEEFEDEPEEKPKWAWWKKWIAMDLTVTAAACALLGLEGLAAFYCDVTKAERCEEVELNAWPTYLPWNRGEMEDPNGT